MIWKFCGKMGNTDETDKKVIFTDFSQDLF